MQTNSVTASSQASSQTFTVTIPSIPRYARITYNYLHPQFGQPQKPMALRGGNSTKTYKPNGAREVARRLRQEEAIDRKRFDKLCGHFAEMAARVFEADGVV